MSWPHEPMDVVHLDLATRSLDALAMRDPSRRATHVVLWWRDLPLGELELAAGAPPGVAALRTMAAAAVVPAVGQRLLGDWFDPPLPERRASRPRPAPPSVAALAGLREPLAHLDAPEPADTAADGAAARQTVSVVLCTRDRPVQLRRALAALSRLDPPPGEVVVVDNAPRTGATQQVVVQFPGVRRVVEVRPGLSRARNTGVAASAGEIIAFTDDDAEVWPSWAQHLAGAFTDPEVMVVTGLVVPGGLDSAGQVVFERHMGGFGQGYRRRTFDRRFFAGMRPYGVPVWRIGAGANMAVRRRVFEQLGGFDERLGAGAAGCSEDSELWYRVLAHGWACRYEPAAAVSHHHRSDLAGVRQQAFHYLRGHVTALAVQYRRHRHPGNLRRALLHMPRWHGRRLARAVTTPDPTVTAELAGYLAGLARIPGAARASPVPQGGRPPAPDERAAPVARPGQTGAGRAP